LIIMSFREERRIFRRAVCKKLLILWLVFAGITAIMIALGFAMPSLSTGAFDMFSEFAAESGIIDESGTMSPVALIINNSRAALLCICYGLMPFMFLPVLVIAFNAALVGFVLAAVAAANGTGVLLLTLCGILPHGIFEITALCLAAAIGCTICLEIVRCIIKKPTILPMGRLFIHSLLAYVACVLPLMVIAGVVESYVTPLVMNLII